MRKLMTMVICLLLVLSLAACSNGKQEPTNSVENSTVVESQETEDNKNSSEATEEITEPVEESSKEDKTSEEATSEDESSAPEESSEKPEESSENLEETSENESSQSNIEDSSEATEPEESSEDGQPAESSENTESDANIEDSSEQAEESSEETSDTTEQDIADAKKAIADSKLMENIKEPAKVGEWVASKRYNEASGKYEDIAWRVVETTIDSASAIEKYNSEDHLYTIQPIEADELSYYLVTYQVYFPEEYTQKDWGITSPSLSLSAKNPEGGGFKYKGISYIGLGSCHDLNVNESNVYSGTIYTGQAIYAMLKEEPDYVFEFSYNIDGESGLHYSYSSNRK